MERWRIDVAATLDADPANQELDANARTQLLAVATPILEETGYEFTDDGLVTFGRKGARLPIARYSVDKIHENGVELTLEYMGLRDGVREPAHLEYVFRGLIFKRGDHTTVLVKD